MTDVEGILYKDLRSNPLLSLSKPATGFTSNPCQSLPCRSALPAAQSSFGDTAPHRNGAYCTPVYCSQAICTLAGHHPAAATLKYTVGGAAHCRTTCRSCTQLPSLAIQCTLTMLALSCLESSNTCRQVHSCCTCTLHLELCTA